MSLSPAAHGLYADLCLLLRLPLPTFDRIEGADAAAVSLDAVKERVFGATAGPPRTERESVERYILAIVRAFDASGATSIDTFDHDVRQHAALCARMSIVLEEHADMCRQCDDARSEVRRLQSIIDEQVTELEDVSADLRRVRESWGSMCQERDNAYDALAKARLQIEDLERKLDSTKQAYSSFRIESFRNAGARDARIDRLTSENEDLRAHMLNACSERDENLAECNAMRQERDEARAALDKARERIERLQEINKQLETRNREATQAGASFGVETCGLLAEKDATIRDVRATFDDLFVKWETTCRERDAARREATASRAELCALNAEISHLRSDLASTRAAHAEITAAHAKLAADVAHKDRLMRDMNAALTHAREEAKAAHDALTVEQGRSERLRAVMVDLISDLNAAKEGAE